MLKIMTMMMIMKVMMMMMMMMMMRRRRRRRRMTTRMIMTMMMIMKVMMMMMMRRRRRRRRRRTRMIMTMLIMMMMIFFEFATVAQHGNRGWNRTCVPIDINPFITHPAHKRLYHKTRVYAPYSLRTECWFFYVPQESEQRKSCETGPTVWRPYPRRLECVTICRCHPTKAAHPLQLF